MNLIEIYELTFNLIWTKYINKKNNKKKGRVLEVKYYTFIYTNKLLLVKQSIF